MKEEPLSPEPYKGVHDYYPEDWARIQAVFSTLRNTLALRGFVEYQASPLERAELYERKTSEEIVSQQTYTFEDRGGRRVTLRPEMTPTLARMVAGKRHDLVFPLRWFSIGNRFRYERPQKGRSREFYQTDVDIVGAAGSDAEAEAVQTAHALLTALGATSADFRIRVNSRALMNSAGNALGLSPEDMTAYLGLLDRKDKMDEATFEESRSPFRRNGTDPLELVLARSHPEVETVYGKFLLLIENLRASGIDNIEFDPTIARGFLYYTGIVFEAFDTNPENPRALLGGGRYDGLVSLFGGEPIPAVGFAIGVETLMDFLTTHNLLPEESFGPDLYIGLPSPSDRTGAEALATRMRARGIRTVVALGEKALGDQVREAARRNTRFFLACGSVEASSSMYRLKELATGTEEPVTEDEIAAFIRARL